MLVEGGMQALNEFATRLRALRKMHMLTQEDLAEKANISRAMVTRYETSQVIPTVEVLVSLADALNVTTDYLLGRDLVAEKEQELPPDGTPSSTDMANTFSKDYPHTIDELKSFILGVVSSSETEKKNSQ